MNTLQKFLTENDYIICEKTDRLIIANHPKYQSVRIEKNRNDFYILISAEITYKSNKFTEIRKAILRYIIK